MRKTFIKSSTVVPHPLEQFSAFPGRKAAIHSTWADHCSVSQPLAYDELQKCLPPPEREYENKGDYSGCKIEKKNKKQSCDGDETHQGVCIGDATKEGGRHTNKRKQYRKYYGTLSKYEPTCVFDIMPEDDLRGYVLVSGRKFEELSRIEALLENEKSALREKCVWAFASDSTEASARVPTENVWLGVEEVCHSEMDLVSQHFISLNDKLRQEHHNMCKTGLEQRANIVINRKKHNTAILRAKDVALLSPGNRAVRWKAVLARDAAAAEERERCLMGFEDALQTCLDKYWEAEARLRDYTLYYRLAVPFRALSEESFRHSHHPGEALKLQLYNSSEIIQRMWRQCWPEVWRKRLKCIVRMQSYVKRKQAMKRWKPIIRARLLIGATAVLKEYFYFWHKKMQTLKWIKQRLGGERLILLQHVMKCWKGVIKERNTRRQNVMERIGRCWQAQLPLEKAWHSWLDHHIRCQDLKGARGRALCISLFAEWSLFTKKSIALKCAIVALSWLQNRWRGHYQRRKWKATQLIRNRVRTLLRISRARRCVRDLLLRDQNSALENYIQRRREEELTALATAEIERVSELQRLVDNAEADAETRFLEQFQIAKKRRRRGVRWRFFTWLLHQNYGTSAQAHDAVREALAKEMDDIKTEQQLHLGSQKKNKDRHRLLSSSKSSSILNDAKQRLISKAINSARIRMIHDFNALRPPQFTCCEPNCRRTFAAEETYREHWARNHHLHGDGTPNGIVDVHLLLIDPKGCHAARCFLAMQGGGDPLNSISFWEGVESWRRNLSTSPEFRKDAEVLYRHFLAPGALSPAIRTCGGDNTGQNKDDQFLDIDSINPKYLDTQQWVTLCAIVKALGKEFWESEVYQHYSKETRAVKMAEEKITSARLKIERQEGLLKFSRDFKTSALEEKTKKRAMISEKITQKVIALALEDVLVSALEGATAIVEMEKEGERTREAMCGVMAEACVWKCAGLIADSCIEWWADDAVITIQNIQDRIEEHQRDNVYYEEGDEAVYWYNEPPCYE